MLCPDLGTKIQEKKQKQHDQHAKHRSFLVGDEVYVKNHGQGGPWKPAEIVSKSGPVSFQVRSS